MEWRVNDKKRGSERLEKVARVGEDLKERKSLSERLDCKKACTSTRSERD